MAFKLPASLNGRRRNDRRINSRKKDESANSQRRNESIPSNLLQHIHFNLRKLSSQLHPSQVSEITSKIYNERVSKWKGGDNSDRKMKISFILKKKHWVDGKLGENFVWVNREHDRNPPICNEMY